MVTMPKSCIVSHSHSAMRSPQRIPSALNPREPYVPCCLLSLHKCRVPDSPSSIHPKPENESVSNRLPVTPLITPLQPYRPVTPPHLLVQSSTHRRENLGFSVALGGKARFYLPSLTSVLHLQLQCWLGLTSLSALLTSVAHFPLLLVIGPVTHALRTVKVI
jgi:hypothetical protein